MADSFLQTLDQAMRIRCFDEFKARLGITDYLKDSGYMPKDTVMRDIAEERGKVSVEFISVYRKGIEPNLVRRNTFVARRGIPVSYSVGGHDRALPIKAMPVILDYEVALWSHDPDKLAKADTDAIFWIQRDPNLNLSLVIGDSAFPLELDMGFNGIQDESTAEMKYDKGLYFCHTMRVSLEAFLFDPSDADSAVTENLIEKIFLTGYDREPHEDILVFEKTIEEPNV